MEGEMLGVLAFGVCAVVVMLVPFLIEGRPRAARAGSSISWRHWRWFIHCADCMGTIRMSNDAAGCRSDFVVRVSSRRFPRRSASEDAPPPQAAAPAEETSCVKCHGESELWEGDRRKLLSPHSNWSTIFTGKRGCVATTVTAATQKPPISSMRTPSRRGFGRSSRPPMCLAFAAIVTRISNSCGATARRPGPISWPNIGPADMASSSKSTADPKVATCVSCHGGHGIRPVSDPQSPVYARELPRLARPVIPIRR